MRLKMITLLMLLISLPVVASATKLQEATFKNGVKLIVDVDHSAPVAMVQIWLKVGGRDEVPGKSGLAHVLEHMMFKGSKKLGPSKFSQLIAAMGGNDNAFTTTDYTAYFETVPSDKVTEVLGLEAERFANLALRKKDFKKEIRVIMEERRMRTDDDPNSHMFELLSATTLLLHPYRNPVIGWMQDLKRLNIKDVRAFYRKHYVPGNVTVVIVGDVDFAKVKQTVAGTFGRLKPRPVGVRFNPVEPAPLGPKRILVRLPAKLPMLAVMIPVPVWKPGHNDKETAALAVATQILSGGRSALLQQKLVDQQRRAFSVGAGYDPFGMGLDLWYAYGMLGPKQPAAAFEKSLWALLGNMAQHPVTAARLAAAKRNIVAAEVFAQDSLYLRAKEIGRMEVSGIGADHRDAWLKAIRAVSAADVQAAVARWLKHDRSTTGTLMPEVKS